MSEEAVIWGVAASFLCEAWVLGVRVANNRAANDLFRTEK